MKKRFVATVFVVLLLACLVSAQEPVHWQKVSEIKAEGFKNSQVMDILSHLTDLYGPRLTGSPNLTAAGEWAVEKLTEWGLENAQLEPWGTFGRGWTTERFSAAMTAPQYMPMIVYPKAWTPGTNGVVKGTPVLLKVDSEEDLEQYKGTLQGKIVMVREPPKAEIHFEADGKRRPEEDLAEMMQAPIPGARSPWLARRAEFRKQRALRNKAAKFLKDEGVAVLLEPSQREHGTIRVGSGGSRDMNGEPALPSLVVAVEQYARIARLLDMNVPVNMEIDIQNKFHTEDSLGYNVVAEIPGTNKKLKKELVMLGGHLDSWHSGTGATDDAAGCAVAMEAVRILQAIGVQPRRTVRIALWSGEEQGLLGSRGYVEKHFGDRRTMQLKPDHANFSAYFNMDNGTGKFRGVYMQENDAARPIFEQWLRPFHDLGASTLAIRNTGGTDHLAFDAVGLPGFQFIQDQIEYGTRTHHTNMDVYDYTINSDLMHNAVMMAAFVYHAAMRAAKFPRKALPKPPAPRQTAQM
ncbi:MAG: M20/M25/M40 family metallo-hydrolase [bacterium]